MTKSRLVIGQALMVSEVQFMVNPDAEEGKMSTSKVDNTGQPGLAESARGAYRFRGQKNTTENQAAVPVTPTTAPRTRPRGRMLIALLLFGACSAGIVTVWDNLIRYQAYGIVTGKVVRVSAPIDGVLKYVHVREGEEVRQDAPLATLFDLEYEQRLSRVADELKIAEATLHAEIAKVQWQSHVQEAEMSKSMAEFFNSASDMYEETATLGVIRNELSRTRALMETKAAKELDLRNQTVQEKAHTEKLESIQKGLRVLKERAEIAASIPRLGTEQIAPLVAKVDMLLNETQRIREWISQGELRAPVNGVVLHRHRPAGECIKSHEPLFSVMEEASLEIEMFLPQEMTADYKVGDTIRLNIEPFEKLVPCRVVAIGAEHRQPPANIEVFYRKSVKLLPVRVRPAAEYVGDKRMAVGAIAKLPHFAGRG